MRYGRAIITTNNAGWLTSEGKGAARRGEWVGKQGREAGARIGALVLPPQDLNAAGSLYIYTFM